MRLLFPREIFIFMIGVCRKIDSRMFVGYRRRLVMFNANHIALMIMIMRGTNLITINLELWEKKI